MIRISKNIVNTLAGYVKEAEKIIITTHFNPDGDAMGSSLGLAAVLKNMGKDVNVIVPNEYPEFLHWLPGNENVIKFNRKKNKCKELFGSSDLIFCLDFNELGRSNELNGILKNTNAKKVLIDHHPLPENSFSIIISEISVSSTCELVYGVLIRAGLKKHIDKDVATCLFTGIMTDTNSFTVNCSHQQTFFTTAELLKYGIDREKIHRAVYDNFSENRQRLLGYVLKNKVTLIPELSTAYFSLSRQELKEFNYRPGDTEGFVNYPLSIKGINFSAFFMEREKYIKISFRSKGVIPVNKIMTDNFRGGGHLNAAGGEEEKLNLDDTIAKFLELLPSYADVLNNNVQ